MDNFEIFVESQIPVFTEEVITTDSPNKIENQTNKSCSIAPKTKINQKPRRKKFEKLLSRSKFKQKSMKKPSLQLNEKEKTPLQLSATEQIIKLQRDEPDVDTEIDIDIEEIDNNTLENPTVSHQQNTDVLDQSVPSSLTSLSIPNTELILPINDISEEEKYFCYEFFDGRPTKTPERYLKIRNHILNCWKISKPAYVTKTSVRNGLKHCGDVKSITRVHLFLEQIGAINFGCGNVEYIRPLISILKTISTEESNEKNSNNITTIENVRQRHKKKLNIDGKGGYTFTHNENGDIIKTEIVSKEQPKTVIKKQPIKLISCRPFSKETKAPFSVKIYISPLLCMDWHAHMSLKEVMGMLGGVFDDYENTLHITRYVPCQSDTNSATHCDMCPVSQSAAYEVIQAEHLSVIGWFHSHPTFSPNPSDQDLETQLNMQQWLQQSTNLPFIGIILSPFNQSTHSTHISDFRCITIQETKHNNEIKFLPFKFNTQVVTDDLDVEKLMEDSKVIFDQRNQLNDSTVDMLASYIYDTSVTHLEKMINSTKMYLNQCGVDNDICNTITNKLRTMLTTK